MASSPTHIPALLIAAALAVQAGRRLQAHTQAKADVQGNRVKLRAAVKTRRQQRMQAAGWSLLLLAFLIAAGALAGASTNPAP